MLTLGMAALLLAGCNKTRETISAKFDELVESSKDEEAEATPIAAPRHTVMLTDTSYDAFVSQRGVLVIVAFSADWCEPCRQLGPVLDTVAGEFGNTVKLGRVNVDHARTTANLAGVRGIPDVRMFRDGRDVTRFTGTRTESQVRKLIRQHLPEPATAARPAGQDDQSPPAEDAPPALRPMEKGWLPPGIEKR